MLLTLLVQTLLLPPAPMPAQYLEVQRNWRLDESGQPMPSSEKRKSFAVELGDGLRRKRNLESGAIQEETLPRSNGFLHLARTHNLRFHVNGDCLRLIATPGEGESRRHEFTWQDGALTRHVAELVSPEKTLHTGTQIATRYKDGTLFEIEIDFHTSVAGAPYHGLQRTTFHATPPDSEPSGGHPETHPTSALTPDNSQF
jgi:hypothetical protein